MTEHKVTIGGDPVTIPDLNGVKAIETMRLVQQVMKLAPDLIRKRTDFINQYRQDNAERLTRGEAKLRFPPVPIAGPDGDIVRDHDGRPLTMDSPIDRMTEHDWSAMNNTLTVYRNPTDMEVGLEVLDDVMDRAIDPFMRLLALAVARNDKVLEHKRAGDLHDWLLGEGEDLMARADLGELMELTVTAVEVANGQVRSKLEQLGDRWGNALSAFGMKVPGARVSPTTSTDSTDSNSTSSTDSPVSTSGTSGRSSEPVGALS
jgi:hypothetical protein